MGCCSCGSDEGRDQAAEGDAEGGGKCVVDGAEGHGVVWLVGDTGKPLGLPLAPQRGGSGRAAGHPPAGHGDGLGAVVGGVDAVTVDGDLVGEGVVAPELGDLDAVAAAARHPAYHALALVGGAVFPAAVVAAVEAVPAAGARGAVGEVLFVLVGKHLCLRLRVAMEES